MSDKVMGLVTKEELLKDLGITPPPLRDKIIVGLIPNRWDLFSFLITIYFSYYVYGFNPVLIGFLSYAGGFFLLGIRLAMSAKLASAWAHDINKLYDLYSPRPMVGGLVLATVFYLLILKTNWYLYV